MCAQFLGTDRVTVSQRTCSEKNLVVRLEKSHDAQKNVYRFKIFSGEETLANGKAYRFGMPSFYVPNFQMGNLPR